MEHAVRPVVEYPIVELTAAAMRTRMLDQHVVVEMLGAFSDKKSIDHAFGALSRQNRMNVIANQATPKQDRMGRDVRISSLLQAQGRDVERLFVFALDHVMGNH